MSLNEVSNHQSCGNRCMWALRIKTRQLSARMQCIVKQRVKVSSCVPLSTLQKTRSLQAISKRVSHKWHHMGWLHRRSNPEFSMINRVLCKIIGFGVLLIPYKTITSAANGMLSRNWQTTLNWCLPTNLVTWLHITLNLPVNRKVTPVYVMKAYG